MHVVLSGRAGAKVNMHVRKLQELDGVVYQMQIQCTDSRRGVPSGVPEVSRNEVQICTWNCRGILRASFRPNLYTLQTMTESAVMVITEIRTCQTNARDLLNQAHGLNYLYTDSLGFVGGMFLLQDINKVFLCLLYTSPSPRD